MVIRTDRPTTPKPTPPTTPPPTTPTTTGPDGLDGTTSVDADLDAAGVTDIERLEGQSLGDGMSLETQAVLKTLTKPSLPTHNPEATAKVKDPAAVVKLINSAAEGLKPGESVTLGGKASAGEGLIVEGGLTISVTKRPDGKLDVKTTEEVAAGPGVKAGAGKTELEAKALIGVAREVTFVVSTGEEAAAIMAKFAMAKAAQTTVLPTMLTEQIYEYATRDQVSERKYAITGELAAVAKDSLSGIGIELGAGDSAAVVESPPGTWFLEFEGTAESATDLETDVFLLDGLRAQGSVKATVRIPIAAPDLDVVTPQGMLRHAEGALGRLGQAEVTLEIRQGIDRVAGGGAVVATKTVKASDMPGAAATTGGWGVRGEGIVGPRESSFAIGPGEVEVTANRTLIFYESSGGNVGDQMKKANEALAQAAQVKSRMIGGH